MSTAIDAPPPPAAGRGAFVVSLDFELHWGVRDKLGLDEYGQNLLGVRDAVPAMLALFTKYDVRATWAIVGLLLTDGRREALERMPRRGTAYGRPELAPEATLAGAGESERDDPFHFAPSLVRRIADTPGQEIGTHTFSHFYCLEEGSTREDLRAELEAAIAVTRDKIGQTPRSIVFPRNQYDASAVAVCGQVGLTVYRGNPAGWAWAARRDGDELQARRAVRLLDAYVPMTGFHTHPLPVPGAALPVNVPASRYLRPYPTAFRAGEPLRRRRIVQEMRRAARLGHQFHLWWHPHDFGRNLAENLYGLERILIELRRLRDTHGFASLSMGEVADRAAPERLAATA